MKTLFVSYAHESGGGNSYFKYNDEKEYITSDDIKDIEKQLEERLKFNAVCVIFFKFIHE